MPGALPLSAQIGIRDHWKKEDSAVQVSFRHLEETLGHKVTIDPEWPLLMTELRDLYAEARDQVANIAETVQVWCKSMVELLDAATDEEWTEKVLEKTESSGGKVRLFLDVDGNITKATTSWSNAREGFVITLPKKERIQPTELFPIFRGELLVCFDGNKTSGLAGADGEGTGTAVISAPDDWADVEMDTTTGTAKVMDRHEAHSSSLTTIPANKLQPSPFLPTVASLPRPDELLLKPPYHLQMRGSKAWIEIQCSHSPSLQLLADYLKRWCRVNHQDTRSPPAITVTLHQSAFGLGSMFDRLTLSTHDTRYTDQFHVTSPMIIALIERVLGYELEKQLSQGSEVWHFRRDTEIKKL